MNAPITHISAPGRADIPVLYMDNHLLAVDKPPGLLAQQDETNDPDLLRLGKRYLKETFDKRGEAFLGLVHRLDRPASGVVVLARTSKAAARLSEQFRRRTPRKEYLALVEGVFRGGGALRHVLSVRRGGGARVAPAGDPAGKEARLRWRSLAVQDDATLLWALLETGRKHQIRIQLAAKGHPVLGDFRYGAARELDGRNLALHAFRLTLTHPTTRERICFCSLPPASWRARAAGAVAEALALPASELVPPLPDANS